MRLRPLPLALLAALASAAPASAAESTVTVGDDFFKEPTVSIQPGDTVNWAWSGSNPHTVTANPNQTEKFASKSQSSGTFSHTFAKAGRFTYFCEVHPVNMRGVVEVGSAPFPDTSLPRLAGATGKPGRGQAVVRFRLSEAARVRLRLRGPSLRTVSRQLGKGSRKLRLRRLKPGRYRATLTATDAAGNKGRSATARFRVSR
jgi:plastocyanin